MSPKGKDEIGKSTTPIFDENSELIGSIHIAKDVAGHKEIQEQLQRAKEAAEAADVAKSEFLANIRHEIRTPMNSIIGFSDMLANENLNGQQQEYVKMIRDSAQNLLSLINDIVDFSKIEAGKLDVEILDCSLGQILNSIESIMKPKAAEKGLEFKIIEREGLPSQIRCDPTRLNQCLVNIVDNAIKFTKQGQVHLKVFVQQIDNKSFICFDIKDTGVGIPLERQAAIFESFTQADGSTTRKYGGTGLGLTITKKLAELLGGRLSLTSQEGKGTTFSLMLPAGLDVSKQPTLDRSDIAVQANDVERPNLRHRFSGSILVAEDNPTNQMLIKQLLKNMGFEVTTAEDGNVALQKTLTHSFDMIFMDIQMPNMDGYETARAMRENGITIPIVALTASTMSGDEGKCICAGCNDYLSKPIKRKELLTTIQKYIPPSNEDLSMETDTAKTKIDNSKLLYHPKDEKSTHPQTPVPTDTQTDQDVIDWDSIMNVCGDEDMVKEIVEIFLTDAPKCMEIIANAIKTENPKDIELYTHRLKGTARHIAAKQLETNANHLERSGRKGDDMTTIESFFEQVRGELEKIMSFFSQPNWIEIAKQHSDENHQRAGQPTLTEH
jgi:signal transduction histidine kinase/DNA-binding NarL/FixJ family response regulator/HPt (histidine-containing phosphotransfer) domain-containing protein